MPRDADGPWRVLPEPAALCEQLELFTPGEIRTTRPGLSPAEAPDFDRHGQLAEVEYRWLKELTTGGRRSRGPRLGVLGPATTDAPFAETRESQTGGSGFPQRARWSATRGASPPAWRFGARSPPCYGQGRIDDLVQGHRPIPCGVPSAGPQPG